MLYGYDSQFNKEEMDFSNKPDPPLTAEDIDAAIEKWKEYFSRPIKLQERIEILPRWLYEILY